jgi:hypothetical protein
MRFQAETTTTPRNGQIDWPTVKGSILAGIDVAAEYTRLGVEFTRPAANAKGIRECHAVGRKDEVPSAFVNVRTGIYHDSGGEGETFSLWDFALRFGQYGRWIDVMKDFAAKAGVEIGNVKAGKGGKIKEAEYHYRDEAGTVRYAVFRSRLPTGKKSFTQHPPDGRGGWKFGVGCMDGIEPLPYRLPELLASDPANDPVWIVEGEKDADRLASFGLVSTTNHQGCNSTDTTWPKFLERFRGRECYIIPDNDPGGRTHAGKVAAYLLPLARSVKVVALPGLPPKGDVSDWLDQEHDVDELGRLAHDAPAWVASETPDPGPKPSGNREGPAVATQAKPTASAATDRAPQSGSKIILEYFRCCYRPVFRRGNAAVCADGATMMMGDAYVMMTSRLIDQLASAEDAPHGGDGEVNRNRLPGFFRTWAPVAWGDLLATLPDEDTAELGDDAPPREEFRRLVREAMLTEVVLGEIIGNVGVVQTERRSLIDWCARFSKVGPWRSIRSKKCWTRLRDMEEGEVEVCVAIRHEVFAQLGADRRLRDMGANTFARRCQRYGVGTSSRDERPHGMTAVVLAPDFVSDLLSTMPGGDAA